MLVGSGGGSRCPAPVGAIKGVRRRTNSGRMTWPLLFHSRTDQWAMYGKVGYPMGNSSPRAMARRSPTGGAPWLRMRSWN